MLCTTTLQDVCMQVSLQTIEGVETLLLLIADLLANLDVDVEANDPISINPVQIGGEDMNVYSAHIMGNVLQ